MKKVFRIFVGLCIGLFLITMVIGCGRNISSQAEAIYAASQLPDFGKFISADSVYGREHMIFRDLVVLSNSDGLARYVVHSIKYEDKNGNHKTVHFDDQRPPRMIILDKKSG